MKTKQISIATTTLFYYFGKLSGDTVDGFRFKDYDEWHDKGF